MILLMVMLHVGVWSLCVCGDYVVQFRPFGSIVCSVQIQCCSNSNSLSGEVVSITCTVRLFMLWSGRLKCRLKYRG